MHAVRALRGPAVLPLRPSAVVMRQLATAPLRQRQKQQAEHPPAVQATQEAQQPEQQPEAEWDVLFRFPTIRGLGLFSRLKIAHAGLMAASTVPAYQAYEAGTLDTMQTGVAAVAVVSATGALYALSWFVRRVVGQLAVSPDNTRVRVSHLTFWGRRNDVVLPTAALFPPLQGLTPDQQEVIVGKLFVPLDFDTATSSPSSSSSTPPASASKPRQCTFLIPLNRGRTTDHIRMQQLLQGTLPQRQ